MATSDTPPPKTPKPRRRFRAFLEERNILGGELVGGVLVVGCSLALVIALWQTFSENPLFQLTTFTAAVAAVFGAGLYTLSRWKLASTSRGLLMIALLLVPISTLSLSLPGQKHGFLGLMSPLLSLLLLSIPTWRAARVMAPGGALTLTLAIVLTSACQAPIVRMLTGLPADAEMLVLGLELMAVLAQVLPAGVFLRSLRRQGPLDASRTGETFAWLGLSVFSLLLTLGLIVFRGSDPVTRLALLALPLALAATPLVAAGTLIHLSLAEDRRSAKRRTAGTILALAGMVLMLLAAVLAWPMPGHVIAVCALNYVVLTLVAVRSGWVLAHVPALPCLSVAGLLLTARMLGLLPVDVEPAQLSRDMLALAYAPGTGLALLALFVLSGVISEILDRFRAAQHSLAYAISGLVHALLSLALVSWRGPHDPMPALFVYAFVGLGTLVCNLRWRQPLATMLGLFLLIGASGWGLLASLGQLTPWWATVLMIEALALLLLYLAPLTRWLMPTPEQKVAWGKVVLSAAWTALPLALAASWLEGFRSWPLAHVLTAAGVGLLFTVYAGATRKPWLALAGSLAILAAVLLLAGWLGHDTLNPERIPAWMGLGSTLFGLLLITAVCSRGWATSVFEAGWSVTAVLASLLALGLVALAPRAPEQALTLACTAMTALILAGRREQAWLTCIASTLSLLSLVQVFTWGIAAGWLAHPQLFALLFHATMVLVVSLALRGWRGARTASGPAWLDRILLVPLSWSATVFSLLALPLLVLALGQEPRQLSFWSLWLADLWLLIAVLNRWPLLFAGFQAALSLAVVLGVHAFAPIPSLQSDALALAFLSLGWASVRAACPPGSLLRNLFPKRLPSMDQAILAVLVVGQLVLALLAIAPELAMELGSPLLAEGRFSLPGAWLMLGLLTAALLLEARANLRFLVLLGLLLLGLAIPVLLAEEFGDAHGTAPVLRWALGIAFLVYSLPLWLRDRIGLQRPSLDAALPWLRRILVTATVAPVLVLTVYPALARLAGHLLPDLPETSVFVSMGVRQATIWPLLMVCVGLILHALREQLPGYAFLVGLGGNLMASLLVRSFHPHQNVADWWLPLLQANAVAFSAAAVLWMAGRRQLYGIRGTGALLVLQLGLAMASAAALVLAIVVPIVRAPGSHPELVQQAAGLWGWLAVALAAGSAAWYAGVQRKARVHLLVLCGLALCPLLAATVSLHAESLWPSFRVLLGSWSVLAVVLLAAGWTLSHRQAELKRVLSGWAIAVGVLVLILTLRLRVEPHDPAGLGFELAALGVLAGLAGAMALWQRREAWFLLGGLFVYQIVGLSLGRLDLTLLPYFLLAGAGISLLWLLLARSLYTTVRPAPAAAPLLLFHLGLGLVGAAVLLLPAAFWLLAAPAERHVLVEAQGSLLGWLGLVAALLPALWYGGRDWQRGGFPLLTVCGLALSVLAACTAAPWGAENWLALHVLTGGCAVVAVTLLLMAPRLPAANVSDPEGLAPNALVCVCITLGALVGLAARSMFGDPFSPWQPAGVLVFVGLVLALLAWLQRAEHWAFLAGIALHAAVSLTVVVVQGLTLPDDWMPLLQANTITAGLIAQLWLAGSQRIYEIARPPLRFAPLLAIQLLAILAAQLGILVAAACHLLADPEHLSSFVRLVGSPLGWLTLTATVLPAAWYGGRDLRRGGLPLLTGLGLALSLQAACSASRWDNGNWLAFHALMAACAVVVVTLLRVAARPRAAKGSGPERLSILAIFCICLTLAGLVGLAAQSLFGDPFTPSWSVGTLIFVALVFARLAWLQRAEFWAFLADVTVLAAVSQVVVFLQGEVVLASWVPLLQANTIAGALVALLWLWSAPRFYSRGSRAPLLKTHIALLFTGNLALLIGPLVLLITEPDLVSPEVRAAGHQVGWLSLLLALVVGFWSVGRILAVGGRHVVIGLALALGVLLACTVARWDEENHLPYLAYHVLTASWAVLAGVILAAGIRRWSRDQWLPMWVAGIGLVVLGLALRGLSDDPLAPWWPAATCATVAGLLAGLALWQRREFWALAATTLLCLAVSLSLRADFLTYLQANLLTCMLVVIAWRPAVRHMYGTPRPGLKQAPLLALHLLAGVVTGAWLVLQPLVLLIIRPGPPLFKSVLLAGTPLSLLALVSVGVAAALHLRTYFRRPGALGVASIGLLVGPLAAFVAARFDQGDHLAFHVLTLAWSLIGPGLLLTALVFARRSRKLASPRVKGWTGLSLDAAVGIGSVAVTAVALRIFFVHTDNPWWSAPFLIAICVQAGVLAILRRSEAWASIATLCIDLAVSLVMWNATPLRGETPLWIWLVQINILSTTVLTLIWLLAGRRLYGDEEPSLRRSPLLSLQVLVGLLGNLVLVVNPSLLYLLLHPGANLSESNIVREADGVWGWLTLGLTAVTAVAHWRLTRIQAGVHVMASLGVAAGVMTAFTSSRWDDGNWLSYHVLMFSWLLVGAVILFLGWLESRYRAWARRGDIPLGAPVVTETVAQAWVSSIGVPVLALAVWGLWIDWGTWSDPGRAWWPAGAILGLGVLAAFLALWLRRQWWAFASGLALNLAFSLVLWRENAGVPVADWWVPLVQANVVGFALTSLVWLMVGRWSRIAGRPDLAAAPLLAVQIFLALVGNLALLIHPAVQIITNPSHPHLVKQGGEPLGYLALLLTVGVALARMQTLLTRAGLNMLLVLGLASSVLASCTAAHWDGGNWLAYHVLTSGWALIGLGLLTAAWRKSIPGPGLPAGLVLGWTAGIALAVLALAARGVFAGPNPPFVDPGNPWWSAGAILAVAGMAGLLALWLRTEGAAFLAAVLINLSVALIMWGLHVSQAIDNWPLPLVQACSAAAALAALPWLAVSRYFARPTLLRPLQAFVGLSAALVLLIPAAVQLCNPGSFSDSLGPAIQLAGTPMAWALLGLASLPALWHTARERKGAVPHLLALVLCAAMVQMACTLRAAGVDAWPVYQMLQGSGLAVAAIVLFLGWRLERRGWSSAFLLQLWVIGLAGAVLAMALVMIQQHPAGPWPGALMLPLVSGLLVGLALWRRRQRWALLAGLVLNLMATVLLLPSGANLQPEAWVLVVQVNLIIASATGLLWLIAAYALSGTSGNGESLPAALLRIGVAGILRLRGPNAFVPPLLIVQTLLLLLTNLGLLAVAGVELIGSPHALTEQVVRTGSSWGWLALWGSLLLGSATLDRRLFLNKRWLTVLGLSVCVLSACTLGNLVSEQMRQSWLCYHVLTFASAGLGLLLLATGWRSGRKSIHEVVVVALVVLFLALWSIQAGADERTWSAAGIVAVSVLFAGLALWQRSEFWAFAAALGVNAAVTLLVGVQAGWVRLVQANTMASAASALVWVLAWRRVYASGRRPTAPLLAVQVLLGMAGNLALLIGPGIHLIALPERPSLDVVQAGSVWGWLTLVLALVPALWHMGRTLARAGAHLVCATALGMGVLLACTTAALTDDSWFAYHTLLVVWALAAPTLALTTLSMVPRKGPASRAGDSTVLWTCLFSMLTLLLALRSVGLESSRLWWSTAGVGAAALAFALLALGLRNEAWAFGAGLCVNLAVSLPLAYANENPLSDAWWLRLIQGNVLAGAVVALAWLAASRRLVSATDRRPLLSLQVLLVLMGNLVLLAGPAYWLIAHPMDQGLGLPVVQEAGTVWGWLTLLLTLAAALWHVGKSLPAWSVPLLCVLGLAVGVRAASTAARFDVGPWFTYHLLLVVWELTALATLAGGFFQSRRQPESSSGTVHICTLLIGLATAALALQCLAEGPSGEEWAKGLLVATAALTVGLALWARFQPYVYLSSLLFAGAMLVPAGGSLSFGLLSSALLGLALSTLFWTAVEWWLRRREPPIDLRNGVWPFTHAAATLAVLLALLLSLGGVLHTTTGVGLAYHEALGFSVLAAITAAVVLQLWDPSARWTLAGLYTLGLSFLGLWLSAAPREQQWLAVPGLGLLLTTAALAWRGGVRFTGLARTLGVPPRSRPWPTAWFPLAQLLLAVGLIALSLWLCLTPRSTVERFGGPLAAALLLPAALLLARSEERWSRPLAQAATLFLGGLVLVELAWTTLDQTAPLAWLERSSWLMSLFSLLTLVYGVVLPRYLDPVSGWPRMGRGSGLLAGVLALVFLGVVLGGEVWLTQQGTDAVLTLPAVLAVAAALALLIVAGLAFAVWADVDPLGLSDRGRTAYVYAGEVLLVVLFLHMRLSSPNLFDARLAEYWPFIVMGLAFAGVLAGAVLERLRLRILAEPLGYTGLFLPLLPVLAFWVHRPGQYSLQWFLMGLVYALVALIRRNLAFALLAACAGNVGLWVVLSDNEMKFVHYPQLWIVPLALTVLVGAELNKHLLSRGQLNTLRYVALTVIYLASTADTFIAGLGQHIARPLVLIGLAIVGVFAGMLLRIRAFLFLGVGFVGMGVVALVGHAARQQQGNWIWPLAGIVLGLLIIVMFGVFEKRRSDILHLLEKLREWE
jgi:hypothetical protein